MDQAIGRDLTAAKQYAEWSRILPDIEQSAEPAKVAVQRIKQRVLAQVAEERRSLIKAGAFPLPDSELSGSILCGLLVDPNNRRWVSALPYALSAASILLVLSFLSVQLYGYLFAASVWSRSGVMRFLLKMINRVRIRSTGAIASGCLRGFAS